AEQDSVFRLKQVDDFALPGRPPRFRCRPAHETTYFARKFSFMKDAEPLANAPPPQIGTPVPQPIEATFGELHSLIDHLHPSRAEHIPRTDTVESSLENELAEVRLGAASGLFMSLRAKHAATAAHSVRVAHQCSIWAAAMQLSVE